MSAVTLLGVVCAIGVLGYVLGRFRASAFISGGMSPHSRPGYHAAFVLLWTLVPSLLVLATILVTQPQIENSYALEEFPPEVVANETLLSLKIGATRNVAEGLEQVAPEVRERLTYGLVEVRGALGQVGIALPSEVEGYMIRGAREIVEYREAAQPIVWGAVIGLAAIGLLGSFMALSPQLRARNLVESATKFGLMLASGVAILTTLGIVLSMLWESLRFFEIIPPQEFFLGLEWDPGFIYAGGEGAGNNKFGLLPLLWGTAYISFIALLIAVPIGLFSAIYMSEFAGPAVRSYAKPLIEVLAGIPTIVYGFFALVTVGPFIRDTINMIPGMGVSASSVATAGIVMGIMIIPFISSLSDDIINAVPQSLRDGAYGLGATKAETVRQVILPAALPGIVGAVLLAASRAIGETMIVVLAAGAATAISLNPFEPMTTVTVKIVSQLTGDVEFTSPQALVAFALGLTLFCVTLVMNIVALRIVRKYREQYE